MQTGDRQEEAKPVRCNATPSKKTIQFITFLNDCLLKCETVPVCFIHKGTVDATNSSPQLFQIEYIVLLREICQLRLTFCFCVLLWSIIKCGQAKNLLTHQQPNSPQTGEKNDQTLICRIPACSEGHQFLCAHSFISLKYCAHLHLTASQIIPLALLAPPATWQCSLERKGQRV